MSVPSAEEKKELGNKAFAIKDFDEAITQYTEAIKLDPTNHVYFSNRSASYGGKKDWDAAATDAKECIKLNPTFLKGFYRLATAQIETNELDAALSTIKQGLNIDADNSQLHKQLRIVKAKKKALSKPSSSAQSSGFAVDPTTNRELMDLQQQWKDSKRDFGTVKAELNMCEREQRVNELTKSELEKLPENDSNGKVYQGVGKMFMLSSRDDIFEHLDHSIKEQSSKGTDLKKKASYLESRMASQEQNIRELLSGAS